MNLCASFKLFPSSFCTLSNPPSCYYRLAPGSLTQSCFWGWHIAKSLSLPHCQSSFLGISIYMWLLNFLSFPPPQTFSFNSFLSHSTSMIHWNGHSWNLSSTYMAFLSPDNLNANIPFTTLGLSFHLLSISLLITSKVSPRFPIYRCYCSPSNIQHLSRSPTFLSLVELKLDGLH